MQRNETASSVCCGMCMLCVMVCVLCCVVCVLHCGWCVCCVVLCVVCVVVCVLLSMWYCVCWVCDVLCVLCVLWCVLHLCVVCLVVCILWYVCVWPDEQLCWEGNHLYLVSFGISCCFSQSLSFHVCSLGKPVLSSNRWLFILFIFHWSCLMVCGNAFAVHLPSSVLLYVHSCLSSTLSLQGWHKL